MTRTVALLLLAACAGAPSPKAAVQPPSPAAKPLTPKEIATLALPSVVLIKTPNMIGTGFVVWKDGRIATNLHVIAGAREAVVTTSDGKEYGNIEVLAADDVHDLAVLRVKADDLPPLPLGDSRTVQAGEHVVAIGHPMGLGNTVSDGLVSAVRSLDPKVTLLQISAPISPGSSGGPLFNERGEVIGVATLYATEGQNLNFAVPIAYLKPLLFAERAVPLAAFAQELEAGVLASCPRDEMKDASSTLFDAIKVGAPLFNKGDHKSCATVYEKASLELLSRIKACQVIRETLLAGLARAKRAQADADKAWALRHAFDLILRVLALQGVGPP